MESIKTCNVCFFSFDAKEHTPRFLPCGHSVCSHCLTSFLNNPLLRKCPFDNLSFSHAQNSLAAFPINFVVMEMLEQKNNNLCKTHLGEKLKFICLTENKKICCECAKQEEHQGHRIKKIKEMKAQGAKVKGELQQTMLHIQEYEQEKEKDCEQIRKVFIKTIDDQFKEIKEILVEKHFELVQQAQNLFNTDKKKDSEGTFAWKQQLDVMLKNIIKTCNDDDGDLILLDKTISGDSSIANMKPQLLKDKSSRVHNKLLEMQNTLANSLKTYKTGIKSLQLSSQEVVKEIHTGHEEQQLCQEELTKINKNLGSIKFTTYFYVKNTSEGLEISAKDSKLKEVEINLDYFQATKKIVLKLNRYEALLKEPSPNLLSYILRGLERFEELHVYFDSKGFKSDSLIWLGNILHGHFHKIKSFYLKFVALKYDRFMQVLGETFLSKVTDPQNVALNFNSCQVHDKHMKALVSSLHPFQKQIESLKIVLDNNEVTDDGVCEILQMAQSMQELRSLRLSLKGTKVTDKSFEIFGERVLPNLKALDSLRVWIDSFYSNRISEKGIWSVLKNLPNLKILELDFSSIPITDKVMKEFLEKVLPRLDSLETFNFIAQNRQIKDVNIQKIHELAKLLNPTQGQIQTEGPLLCSKETIQYCP